MKMAHLPEMELFEDTDNVYVRYRGEGVTLAIFERLTYVGALGLRNGYVPLDLTLADVSPGVLHHLRLSGFEVERDAGDEDVDDTAEVLGFR